MEHIVISESKHVNRQMIAARELLCMLSVISAETSSSALLMKVSTGLSGEIACGFDESKQHWTIHSCTMDWLRHIIPRRFKPTPENRRQTKTSTTAHALCPLLE